MSCYYYSTEWQRGEYGYSWDSLTTSVSFLKKSKQQQQICFSYNWSWDSKISSLFYFFSNTFVGGGWRFACPWWEPDWMLVCPRSITIWSLDWRSLKVEATRPRSLGTQTTSPNHSIPGQWFQNWPRVKKNADTRHPAKHSKLTYPRVGPGNLLT